LHIAKEAVLQDAQGMADALLEAEKKLRQMLSIRRQQETITESKTGMTLGSKSFLPDGLKKQKAYIKQGFLLRILKSSKK
jgi:hypothetical protein